MSTRSAEGMGPCLGLRCRNRPGVCPGFNVKINAEDAAELVVGKRVIRHTGSGAGQGHLGSDQFLCIGIAQPEEEFWLGIEPTTHTVKGRGNVLAHHRPIGASAGMLRRNWYARPAGHAIG